MDSCTAYGWLEHLPLAAAIVRQSGEVCNTNVLFKDKLASVWGLRQQTITLKDLFTTPTSEELADILAKEQELGYIVVELKVPAEREAPRLDVAIKRIQPQDSSPVFLVILRACQRVRQAFEREVNERALVANKLLGWQYHFKTHDFFVSGDLRSVIGYTTEETTPFTLALWDKLVERRLINNVPPVLWETPDKTDFKDYLRVRHKNGSLVWVAIRGTVTHRDDEGYPLIMAGLMGELADEAFNLDALLSAKEAAEADIKKRTDFIASLSHEIRTPLNSLIGMTHILAEMERDPFKKERLQQLNDSSKGLLGTLNGLLEHAKLADYGLALVSADMNLIETIKSTIAIFRQPAQLKNIRLTYTVGRNVPDTIYSDKLKLIQIISNLLSNAVKFTLEGKISLYAGVADGEAESSRLLISVKDNGIGLSEAEQNNIFEPFYQSEHSINHSPGGTGLGLSISRQLAECLGGKLTVNSKLGHGSTFTLSLPLKLLRPTALANPVNDEEVVGIKKLTTPPSAYRAYEINNGPKCALLKGNLKVLWSKLTEFDLAAPAISADVKASLVGSELDVDYAVIHEKIASLRFDLAERLVSEFLSRFEEN